MQNLIARLFRVQPTETGVLLALGFLLFVNAASQQISGVVAVSGFLSTVGAEQLLIVWIVNYGLLAFTAVLQSLIVDRFNRVQLLSWMTIIFAAIFLGLRLLFALNAPDAITYSILYIISDQQWLFFPAVLWTMANDTFDMAQAKRLFPVIAALGFVGKIGGILVALFSPSFLSAIQASSVEVLNVITVLYILGFIVVRWKLVTIKVRKTIPKKETFGKVITESWDFVSNIPLFRYLAFSVVALIICHIIIEYRFLVVTSSDITDAASFQQFYSAFRLGVALTAFALQSFVTSRVIERLTLKNTIFVMPVSVLLGMIWLLIAPGVVSAVGAMALNRLPRDTIDDSTHRSLQALVPEERRGRVTLFMDNMMIGFGSVIGCIVTAMIVWLGGAAFGRSHFYMYISLGVGCAIVGVMGVWLVRRSYDASLLNWRLKRRQRTASVLDKLDF